MYLLLPPGLIAREQQCTLPGELYAECLRGRANCTVCRYTRDRRIVHVGYTICQIVYPLYNLCIIDALCIQFLRSCTLQIAA